MKIIQTLALGGAAVLASAAPAFAHTGDHSASAMANIMHWLSSPSHALFSVVGGVIAAGLIIKFINKKRA